MLKVKHFYNQVLKNYVLINHSIFKQFCDKFYNIVFFISFNLSFFTDFLLFWLLSSLFLWKLAILLLFVVNSFSSSKLENNSATKLPKFNINSFIFYGTVQTALKPDSYGQKNISNALRYVILLCWSSHL